MPTDPIWIAGPILTTIQSANVFKDCKDFVDSPLVVSPDEAWRRWDALPNKSSEALTAFVNTTFAAPGGELASWHPPDFEPSPPLLAKLPAGQVRDWASKLNEMWSELGRRVSPSVLSAPDRTTLLPAAHGFVVPGGRFREAYYWDSYWVVLGLLACNMSATASSLTRNLLDTVHTYGFVPNGLRSYYLNRSQPPMLTQMVAAIVEHDDGLASSPCDTANNATRLTLREALPLLDMEYEWWMRKGDDSSAVHLEATSDGKPAAVLNRYVVRTSSPRPESWREDDATAKKVPTPQRPQVYADLAAAAESGWDFSSRWLADGSRLETIRTSKIVPIDLNAMLYRNERTLHRLHAACAKQMEVGASNRDEAKKDEACEEEDAKAAEHAAASDRYAAAADARRAAMSAWMWQSDTKRWHDLELTLASSSKQQHYTAEALPNESVASYLPLWAGCYADEAQASAAVDSLTKSQLVQAGGVATTLVATGEQWDWPNAWPPLQQMLIDGLLSCGVESAKALGTELASRWLKSGLLGWRKSGYMHEKYDATRPGERGGGGEYNPQVGFGWTNGVVLWLLDTFAGTPLLEGLE